MSVEIRIPSVGESISEVVIAQWFRKDGDFVEKDEPLLEMETDKVNAELNSPEAGVLRVSAGEGESRAVGDVVGSIEPGPRPTNGATAKAEAKKESTGAEPVAAAPGSEGTKASSVAKKVAAEFGVSLEGVAGKGIGGRITKADVLAFVEEKSQSALPAPAQPTSPALPAVSGASAAGPRAVRRERLSTLRKKIAVRLVEAQHTAAILTTFNEVDMSAVMELRVKYKEPFQKKHGVGLGFMSFFVKASIEALRLYPRINACIENDEVVYHDYVDVGVAVGTDRGLVVPVIRNAESLTFAGIEKAIKDYGEKAKAGKLTIEDLSGGTFTISNGGVYGSMLSTPILNPPQSGILGMHNIVRRPVALGEEIRIRPIMYLALSYDHRIVDGKEAVSFLVRVKECIETPERLLLEV